VLEAIPIARPESAAPGDIYYIERDNLTGKSTYRLSVVEGTADLAVIASQNISPIRIAVPHRPDGECQASSICRIRGNRIPQVSVQYE
jgi:hypothetical protein